MQQQHRIQFKGHMINNEKLVPLTEKTTSSPLLLRVQLIFSFLSAYKPSHISMQCL